MENMKGSPTANNIRVEIIQDGFTAMQHVDNKESRSEKALVIQVGPDVKRIKPNDIVLYKAYNLEEDKMGDYVIIPEEEVKYLWSTCTTTKKSTKRKTVS